MEEIKKTISLEPFYSRQKSKIPFVGMKDGEEYPNLNWGRIAYGVDFDSMGEDDVKKYGMGVKKLGKMTFQELMKEYHKVMKGEAIPTDDDEKLRAIVAFVNEKKVIDMPQPPEDPCCNPCAVQSPPDVYEMDSPGEPYFEPEISFDVCLTQSANIIGTYTFATKDWIAGKRYFAGDKVIYDGKTYVLKPFNGVEMISGSGVNCGGEPLMRVGFYKSGQATAFTEVVDTFIEHDGIYGGLSESLFDEYTVTSETEIVDNGYVYAKLIDSNPDSNLATYYIRPSWGGFNNSLDGKVYFDELLNVYNPDSGFKMMGTYETNHWEIADKIYSNGTYGISSCGDGLEITVETKYTRDLGYGDNAFSGNIWESKLVNFKRNQKSTDVDGNELPGRFNSLGYNVLDLPYLIGTIKNIDTTNTIPIGDYLASIQVVPDHQGLLSIYIMEETTGITYDHGIECTSYTYTPVTMWESAPGERFIGSTERSGNDFVIYDEWSNLIFDSAVDIPGNDYMILVTTGGAIISENNAIKYDLDENPETIDGVPIKRTPGKIARTGYTPSGINQGGTSYNGGGFTIEPTGGTENDYSVIADKMVDGYQYVKYETLNTYTELVENWDGETGTLYFTYYIGAELELENIGGEVVDDANYVYNNGEVRIIYKDVYRFTARRTTSKVYNENGDVENKEYVYIDIDYDSKKSDVVYENIYNYRDRVILSNISVTSNTITEGGEPVSTDFQNADYFMEDYQLGIAFVANNNDNVYIDRGSAAAFERHMRLSEVDTMEDLEIMGNGSFFRMKS